MGSPAFVRLTAMDFSYFLAAGMLLFALPLYAVGPLGAGEVGAGLAFGVYSLTALVLRPLAGRLCDQSGRRVLLVPGAALAAASALTFLLTSHIVGVVAVGLVMGVAEAAFFVAGFVALAGLALGPPSSRRPWTIR